MIEHNSTYNGTFKMDNLNKIAEASIKFEEEVFNFVFAMKTAFERAPKDESVNVVLNKLFFSFYVPKVETALKSFETILEGNYSYQEIVMARAVLPNFDAIKNTCKLIKVREGLNPRIAETSKNIIKRILKVDQRARGTFRFK